MSKTQIKLDKYDYLLAGLLPITGILLTFGAQIFNRESLYLGIIQEQYFLLGQFSFDHLIRREFAEGYFPLWNHNNALGTPLFGNMLSAVFYPVKIFLYLFPGFISYELYVIFRVWLGGFFAYLLGRKLGLARASSAFVSAGFAFSGYFQIFLNENYLNADLLLPLFILLALYLAQSKSKWWVLALCFSLFALFNSGHPEAIFYNWLFLMLSFLGFSLTLEKPERFSAYFRFICANVIAVFLSLPLILTFLEFWVRGYHFHLPGTGLYHYSIREFLALFSPWFFGPSSPGSAFFHKPELTGQLPSLFFDYSKTSLPWLIPSLGLLFLPLMILSFLELKKLSRIYLLWLLWIIIFLGLSFGLPGFQFLGLVFPFSLSGNFKHPIPAMILATAILSALMLEKVLAGKIGWKKLTLAFSVCVFLLALFFPYSDFRLAHNYYLLIETSVSVLFFCFIFFKRIAEAKVCRREPNNLFIDLSFALAIIVLFISAQTRSGWQSPVYPDYHLNTLRQNPVFNQIKQDPGSPRFYFEREIFPPNLNQLLEVPDLRIMDGVNHHRLVELVNRINGHTREQGFNYWYNQVGYLEVMPEKIEDPILDLTGLKYIITRSPLPYHRSIERILEKAEKKADSSAHIGLAYFPLGNATAKTLFQHPPSIIRFKRCDIYESLPGFCCKAQRDFESVFIPPLLLSFAPSIQPEAFSREPDGVWFLLSSAGQLNYARYVHPGRHPEERALPISEMNLGNAEKVSLATLPLNNSDYDWAGWLDLRVDVPRQTEKLELLSNNQFWFYRNPDSYPRFFLASAGELEKEKADNIKKEARIILFQGTPNSSELLLDPEQGGIQIKRLSSQRFEMELFAPENCWLVLSQILFPGWNAKVDGKEQRLLPLDFLTGLELTPGPHQIEIFYKPWSFRVGLNFSLVSLVWLVAMGLMKKRKTF